MMKQAIILAGGRGTRLAERLGDLPKPMIPIGGKPLLEHQVELLRAHGFNEIIMFVHHRAELIQAYFAEREDLGMRIRFVIETQPLGTAGAVMAGGDHLAETFLVLYGDTMLNVDLSRIWAVHERSGAEATLFLHPNNHPFDSDLVEVDSNDRVIAFHHRPHSDDRFFQNLVNAGLYVMNKSMLIPLLGAGLPSEASDLPLQFRNSGANAYPGQAIDFGRDVFPSALGAGKHLNGYNSPEFIKDIGTPSRYDWVCGQFATGIVQRSSFRTPQRAAFLDRDGTIIREVNRQGLTSIDDVELIPGAATAIRTLNNAGIRVVLITNQPVVAKGLVTVSQLANVHNKLETLLGREHAFLDRIYICPHHPDSGFEGEVPALKCKCSCRKPNTGLIDRAVRDLNIDCRESWLVGDTTTDIQTAHNAGLRSILVKTGYGGSDARYPAKPIFVRADLLEAVKLILSLNPS